MREWKDQGIILKIGLFKEADYWLRILCRNKGLHTVFAFGGAKSIKRFCGTLDIFNKLDCRIRFSKRGEYLNLEEASLMVSPVRMRYDWKRMGLAANCFGFMNRLEIGPENSAACFDILDNLLNLFELAKNPDILTPLFFRLRIAAAIGYSPEFLKCGKCGNNALSAGFFPQDGTMLCADCKTDAEKTKRNIRLTKQCQELLTSVKSAMPALWPEKKLEKYEKKLCAQAIDSFIRCHLGV